MRSMAVSPSVQTPGSRWVWAFALACCIEALALFALSQWIHADPPVAEAGHEIELSIEKPEPAPPVVAVPKPVPLPQPKTLPPVHTPPLPTQVATTERTEVAAEPPPKPAPAPLRDNVTAVATPPVASNKAPDHSEYMAKVRAAVQQAFVYPAAASSLGLHGRVKVKFKLNQKTPTQAQVLITSGVSMIDRAAMASVMNARYPEPTAEINLSQMEFEIWIEYRPS